jgi:hypothetical protein
MWRLTRLEGRPGVILHTFDLAGGYWQEHDPEVITWRKYEHGLRRAQDSEIIWTDLEISYLRGEAVPGIFKNMMVAWLEKVRHALSKEMKPELPSGEEERFAFFISRRLGALPSSYMAKEIDSALRQRIWDQEALTSKFPLRKPPSVQISLSRELATQSADLARINRESPNFLPLLDFISPTWWSRRDLLQNKVLRAANPLFKDFSNAGLRWLRRVQKDDLSYFNFLFDDGKEDGHSDAYLYSTAKEMAEVMVGLSPQAAGLSELTGPIMGLVWRLLLKLNNIMPKPDPLLAHRLPRFLARYIITEIWAAYKQYYLEWDEDEADAIDETINNDIEEIIDWFRAEGQRQGLPDKNSTWQSLKRRSDKWHEEGWRRKMSKENVTWESALEEMLIDGIKITPLISDLEVYREGRRMRHCVSSYISRCLEEGCRIFSLTEENGQHSTLSLIPENGNYIIDQHKGPDNGPVSPAAARAAQEVCRLYTQKYLETAVAAA